MLPVDPAGRKRPPSLPWRIVMLTLIYRVLQTQQPFQDRKTPPLGEPQRQRMIRHHIRRLGKLGIAIPRVAYLPATTSMD